MSTPPEKPSNVFNLVPRAAASSGERLGAGHVIDPERMDRLVDEGTGRLVFDGGACRDYLDHLTRRLEERDEAQAERPRGFSGDEWDKAGVVLERCGDFTAEGLADAARRFLAVADWQSRPHLAVALARLADGALAATVLTTLAVALADSPLLVDEVRAAAGLDLRANIVVARLSRLYAGDAESHHALANFPGYVAFAETGLATAAARLRDIHGGKLPYGADKAFTLEEAAVIARLARVALDRDETWLPPLLDEVFRKVSLAPTAAKSVPSQSVAIQLGHAIEALPTPEAVATLRAVFRDLRHAGVKHKLQRNIRGAERGLAARPEVALRLSTDQPIGKSQLKTLARCLEGGFALGMTLDAADWSARLAGNAQVKALTCALVWRLLDDDGAGISFLPVAERHGMSLRDVDGMAIAPAPGGRVALWHPADVGAEEREAWRARIAGLRVRQPFKQVFREHYRVSEDEAAGRKTMQFAGHIVSIIPLLGLARGERWSIDDDGLTRSFGRWTARLELADPVYPGCAGATTTGALVVSRADAASAAAFRLGDLPPATLSEILRAVDLLVSTSGVAVTAEDSRRHHDDRIHRLALSRLSAMVDMRKRALGAVFQGVDALAEARFDARHLRLGRYAIHLATGRVTRDGEPIDYEPPKRSNLTAVPWLPHDEKLLEVIAYTAFDLARRTQI